MSCYERDWQKKLGHELKNQYFARRLYQRLSDRQVDRIISYFVTNGIMDSLLKEQGISFDRHGSLLLKALKLGIASQTKRLLGSVTSPFTKGD
jgi:flavin-dependent dehydrogenase